MTLTAVLLAGGESQRMGRDKATIVFHGLPLWQRQINLLRNLRPEKIFVSARKEPSWLPLEAELLLDEPPSRGPLSGLARALERMQTSHLMALAVDMPFMTSEQLQELLSLAAMGCGVLPMIAGRVEPLAAIYPRESSSDFSAALACDDCHPSENDRQKSRSPTRSGDFSLQRLGRSLVQAGRLRMFQVSPSKTELYRSVNAPGDFKEGPFPNRAPGSVGGLESAAP
jgi:molybdopterin-guanine dinucleotide biosynthesis protein A